MPVEFDKCVKDGGKVTTKQLNKNQYMHICFIGGKSYSGEVRQYKKILGKGQKHGKKR